MSALSRRRDQAVDRFFQDGGGVFGEGRFVRNETGRVHAVRLAAPADDGLLVIACVCGVQTDDLRATALTLAAAPVCERCARLLG